MKKTTSKKFAIIALVAVFAVGFAALIVHNYKTKTSLKYANQKSEELKPEQNPQDAVSAKVNEEAAKKALAETRKNSDILKITAHDTVLGDKNAPVTMIEYASLSCPHCASFSRESFEKLKTEFIDSGKMKFVFRHFPLNQPALVASMFMECQTQDHKNEAVEKYYFTLKALMKTQDSWAFDDKFAERLEGIAKLDGMSSERFNSCINDKKLQEKILSERMEVSQTLQLKSTPSFFVNGEISEGYIDYQTLKKLIESKLAEKK
jgi:protein-disulfide isomerase